MSMYQAINDLPESHKGFTLDNLIALREHLRKQIPTRTVRSTLLLATWNIRDFDSNQFNHGPRLPECYFYIAEIINSFDLIALQEVNEDLAALTNVMQILGPSWDYIATDHNEGSGRNQERMVFLFDTRKVRFKNIAGEIVLPKRKLISGELQFARTPFLVSFQSGWFKFSLCTVHIYFGEKSGAGYQRRVEEINSISDFLAKRAQKEESNIILLGDFNITGLEDETMLALKKGGFVIPAELQYKTNMKRDMHYDQIAFMLRKDELQLGSSTPNAGVFNYYEVLFKPDMYPHYHHLIQNREVEAYRSVEEMNKVKEKWEIDMDGKPMDNVKRESYFQDVWRTFQMSDHLPLWVELKIDFSDAYLNQLTL
jgi:endonuclease/exonuclease/phosphatase family metal-dependent hydrolase